jgi:hypothetical protein
MLRTKSAIVSLVLQGYCALLALRGGEAAADSTASARTIAGAASVEQKQEVADRIAQIFYYARHPAEMRLESMRKAFQARLIVSECSLLDRGYRRCGFYDPENPPVSVLALTSLYILSELSEADHGAFALWQIDTRRACVSSDLTTLLAQSQPSLSSPAILAEPFSMVEDERTAPLFYVYSVSAGQWPLVMLRITLQNGCVAAIDLRAEDLSCARYHQHQSNRGCVVCY